MVFSILDILLPPIYLIIIYLISKRIRDKNVQKNPAYKFYLPGLFIKFIGGIGVCLVYTVYYSHGDTISYYTSTLNMANLLFLDPWMFLKILFGPFSKPNIWYMSALTGDPAIVDQNSFYIVRIATFCTLLSFKSYVASTILLAWICYSGIWKLYLTFCEEFPRLYKQLSFPILFVPSVVFWGSGMLKDTVTLSAIGWFTFSFYQLFIRRKRWMTNSVYLFISAYLLLAIRPFMLFALLPGAMVWLAGLSMTQVKGNVLKYIIGPLFGVMALAAGYFILYSISEQLGVYSVNNILNRALEVQIDLKQDFYQGNSFDIGTFDPTVYGILSKTHLAIIAALFRPFIWEAKNPVMFISGMENFYIVVLTISLLFRTRIFFFFHYIFQHHLLIFSFIFGLFFAFSVGLTTSNFGSLVRYKIPCIPFYLSTLIVVRYLHKQSFTLDKPTITSSAI